MLRGLPPPQHTPGAPRRLPQADECRTEGEGQGQTSAVRAGLCEEDAQQACAASLELRSLIHDVHRTLCDRFDRLDARLDELAEQLAGGRVEAAPGGPPADVGGDASADGGESSCGPQEETAEDPEVVSRQTSMSAVRQGSNRTLGEAPAQLYRLRHEWQMDTGHLEKRELNQVEDQWKTLDDFVDNTFDLEQTDNRRLPRWIIWPSSNFRLAWDAVTMMLIAYDMAVIPVQLAFEREDNAISSALFWPALLFWTTDILLSFFTGYYRNGYVETSHWKIMRSYLCTWFFLDAFMVCSAWAEAFIGLQSDPMALGRVGKTLRILRIIRSMRLVRLVKLRRIMEDIQDRITSEYFHIIMAVFRLSIFVIWSNHFIACLWWAIGASGPRQGDADAASSWTSHFRLQHSELGYQYFTALHWSLTQFTPASMEITPRNTLERVFAVVVLIFAMIVFSSFVSSITAAMTQLRQLTTGIDKNFIVLRRYLRVRNAPVDLTLRIVRCVEHRLGARKEEIPEADVQFLQYLSQPLQMELLSHVYSPVLTRHPFFKRYGDADPVALQQVCAAAIEQISLSTGDMLFTEACSGDQLFFVLRGKLRYFRKCAFDTEASGPATVSHAQQNMIQMLTRTSERGLQRRSSLQRSPAYRPVSDYTLAEGDWFCETSLWCPWAHMGTMLAMGMCDVLAVDAAALARVTSTRRLVVRGAQRYSKGFVDKLNREPPGESISDVCPLGPEIIEDLAQRAFRPRRSSSLTKISQSSDCDLTEHGDQATGGKSKGSASEQVAEGSRSWCQSQVVGL